jgi:hypothetical protein
MNVMATNATTIKNGACWYGLHFGCVNTNDRVCTKGGLKAINMSGWYRIGPMIAKAVEKHPHAAK